VRSGRPSWPSPQSQPLPLSLRPHSPRRRRPSRPACTPLSGLGIQAHEPREHWYPPEELWATLDALAGTGLPLHITELHPQSSGKPITGGFTLRN
jgi:hypothetical protein